MQHETNFSTASDPNKTLANHAPAENQLVCLVACHSAIGGSALLFKQLHCKSIPTPGIQASAFDHTQGDYATWEEASNLVYHVIATTRKRFLFLDTADEKQLLYHAVTHSIRIDIGLLVVDASGALPLQIKRNAYLLSKMGVSHVILAINKSNLSSIDAVIFKQIEAEFREYAKPLDFQNIHAIPISLNNGDNIGFRSIQASWHGSGTLLDQLELIKVVDKTTNRVLFSARTPCLSNASLKKVSGSVIEGSLKIGDDIRASYSGNVAKVTEIRNEKEVLAVANIGEAVTLELSQEIAISNGEVFAPHRDPLETTDQFEATLIWLGMDLGFEGRSYDISLASQTGSASITSIKYLINTGTLAREASASLSLDDISVCNIATSHSFAYDSYSNSNSLGSFILFDRVTRAKVAIGMIRHSLRRAQNVHRQALAITRFDREKLNRHSGKVIWFTGLSGSGKSSIANTLEVQLHAQGRRTYILDGDNVRQGLNKDLGFTEADRIENIRRITEVAKLMMDAGVIVMTAFISPFRREREMARESIGTENFIEVYVDTPIEICEKRDVKGLYKKARAGQIPNMTGVNSPYEIPEQPDVVVNGHSHTLAENVALLLTACNVEIDYS